MSGKERINKAASAMDISEAKGDFLKSTWKIQTIGTICPPKRLSCKYIQYSILCKKPPLTPPS